MTARSLVVSDLRSEAKGSGSSLDANYLHEVSSVQ